MKRYVLKKVKEKRIFKKIVYRKELHTFNNTYMFKKLSSSDNINFKKIKNRINSINNYIAKIREKFTSLSYNFLKIWKKILVN